MVAHIIAATDSLDLVQKAGLVGVETPAKTFFARVSKIELYPVAPNPNTGSAHIRYALPAPSQVSLQVYDISGRLVRELEKREKAAGLHDIRWDGRDEKGRAVPSGVYLYRIQTQSQSVSRSLILLH